MPEINAILPWLPPCPEDFAARCKQAGAEPADLAAKLRELAGFALDDNALHRLAKVLAKAQSQFATGIPGLHPYRLGVVSNGTTKLIKPCLTATGLRYGLELTVIEGEFNQPFQEAHDPQSKIRSSDAEGVLIALDHRGIPGLEAGVRDEAEGVNDAIRFVQSLIEGFQQSGKSTVIVQSVPCPPLSLFGSLDARLAGSQRRRIERFNDALNDLLASMHGLLLDAAGLARRVGDDAWFAAKEWHLAKLPFAQILTPLYAEHVARLIGAITGKSRKCLVLDLDNTLWGGVIGDDGLNGIRLGQGDAGGEAHLEVQQVAKLLHARGIILAVCSKNTDEVARAVFRDHPDMILREDDIAVFQANWSDKASNLEAIAKALNISTQALVFLDDNPAERAQVRQALPEVAVPEVPDDPSVYPGILLAAGYFESVAFTDDDRQRAGQYQANAARAQLAEGTRDVGSFLQSLEMVIRFHPFDAAGRARIAQLANRSNQFNLTTRRYDEAAIAALEQDPAAFTLQVRLADRFGDNGMISILVCRHEQDVWLIETWLMSCRVLNRRVEEAVLDILVANARAAGAKALVGHFIPTERNAMVKEHYGKLGFTLVSATETLDTWRLELANYEFRHPPMQVVADGSILAS